MYRFLVRPKWLGFHLLVVAAVVLMVNLAFWQMRRLDERQAFNATVRSRSEQPLAPFSSVVEPRTDPADVEWRPVTVTGTYLADEQLVVVNRGQGGFAGVNVVTPLQLPDGLLLLVNRGFVPTPGEPPPPPGGTVTVTGHLRASQRRALGQLSDPAAGRLTEVQRIDIDRIAGQLPGEVARVYVDLAASDPPEGDVPIPLPEPELSEGSHLSYTIQWFVFSAAVVVGWVLAVRWSVKKRRVAAGGAESPIEAGVRDGDPATTVPR